MRQVIYGDLEIKGALYINGNKVTSGQSVHRNNIIAQAKIGVGTDSPQHEIDVNGTIGARQEFNIVVDKDEVVIHNGGVVVL